MPPDKKRSLLVDLPWPPAANNSNAREGRVPFFAYLKGVSSPNACLCVSARGGGRGGVTQSHLASSFSLDVTRKRGAAPCTSDERVGPSRTENKTSNDPNGHSQRATSFTKASKKPARGYGSSLGGEGRTAAGFLSFSYTHPSRAPHPPATHKTFGAYDPRGRDTTTAVSRNHSRILALLFPHAHRERDRRRISYARFATSQFPLLCFLPNKIEVSAVNSAAGTSNCSLSNESTFITG